MRNLFHSIQLGTVDRGMLSPVGNFYMTPAVLADLKASLRPLGPPRLIELERESQRGGMTTRHWKILCRTARLEAVERSSSRRQDRGIHDRQKRRLKTPPKASSDVGNGLLTDLNNPTTRV